MRRNAGSVHRSWNAFYHSGKIAEGWRLMIATVQHGASRWNGEFSRRNYDRVAPPSRLGRRGREATRGYIICVNLSQDRLNGENWDRAFFRTVDQARRGLLSLRDPAGAAHAAGPPCQ